MASAPPNWFIAWPVDAPALTRSLRRELPAGLRCIADADLHITLAFLGSVGEARAHDAWAHALTLPCPAFDVAAQRLVALGKPSRPSAYGVMFDDEQGSLADFIGQHRDALRESAGVNAESRPPLPHLTLARPPRSAGPVIRKCASDWIDDGELPSTRLELDRLALYRRAPDGHASRFQRVAERSSPART